MKTKKSLPEPDKEQRKKLLIEMMQEDEKNGMYEQSESPLIGEPKRIELTDVRVASDGNFEAFCLECGKYFHFMGTKPMYCYGPHDLDTAARNHAVKHSSAPDKETPDWIISDFKAGAEWAAAKSTALIGERSAEEMTLQQCKEKIAKLYGFDNWDRIDFYMLDSQDQTAQRPYAEERLNDEVAELYASQFKAFGEWISVWDKNPETKGYYLTVNLERDETPFVAFYNTVEWRTDNGTWTHPTHWQPLPSPPRIEKQTI